MLEATLNEMNAAMKFSRDLIDEEVRQEDAARADRKASFLAPEGQYGATLISWEKADPSKLFDSEKDSGACFYSTNWSVSNEAGEFEIRYVRLTPSKWVNANGKPDMTYINARNLFLHGGVEEIEGLLEWARHNTVPVKVTVAANGKRNYMSIQRPR